MRVSEPYKRASRSFHPEDTVVDIGDVKIGGKKIAVIAGPCSVESQQQIDGIAEAVKLSGGGYVARGAFKPRTSPYSFQGLRDSGLEMLHHASKKAKIPVVTEIMSADKLGAFLDDDMMLYKLVPGICRILNY